MHTYFASITGAVRDENQDSVAVFGVDSDTVLLVCDGMGGHKGGKRASQLACDVIQKRMTEEYKSGCDDFAAEELMRNCFNEANAVIWQHSVREPENRGMGTTMVMALLRNGKYIILNVGDSRAYSIGEKISQITVDQSYVQSLVVRGEITPEQARNYPGKNIILQAAGVGDVITPDVYKGECENAILLCSDGLTNELDDETIYKIIGENSFEDTVGMLAEAASAAGGNDNITVAAAFFKEDR